MKCKLLNVLVTITMLLALAPINLSAGPVELPQANATNVPTVSLAPTEYWERVAGADATQGAGTGDVDDVEVLSIKVFNTSGVDTLFAGTRDRGGTSGGMVVRSQDGTNWTAVTNEGLGDVAQEGVFALEDYNSFLYAATGCPTAGACTPQVWRTQSGSAQSAWTFPSQPSFGADIDTINDMIVYDPQDGGGPRLWIAAGDENGGGGVGQIWSWNNSGWSRETIVGLGTNVNTFVALAIFNNDLWVAAGSGVGAEIWRRDRQTNAWVKVAQDGLLGDGTTWLNDSGRVMTVYKGALYVGMRNVNEGAQLFYTRDGVNFVQVFRNGLDTTTNRAVRDLLEVNGDLYMTMDSCTNWTCTAVAANGRARIYRSSDGVQWSPVGAPGFGDLTNRGATRMAVLKSGASRFLYVGTLNFDAAAFGAQVWRTPAPQPEERWQQVVGPLPTAGNAGFDPTYNDAGGNHNFEATTFEIYNNVLYAGVRNDGAPAASPGPGAQVYKTVDGNHWVRVGPPGLVAGSGMDDVFDLQVFENELYAAAAGGGIGRVYKLKSDGNTWEQVGLDDLGTADNTAVTRLAAFSNALYAGTAGATQARVHRWQGGTWTDLNVPWGNTELQVTSLYVFKNNLYAGTQSTNGSDLWSSSGSGWTSITTDGFGSLPNTTNLAFTAMIEFNGYLYVGTRNTDNPDDDDPENEEGGRIYRSADGSSGSFAEVSRRGFSRNAIATTTDPNNVAITAFGVYNGYLYAGTEKADCTVADPKCRDLGAEVWRTDGVTVDPYLSGRLAWEQVSTDGFSFFQNFRVADLKEYKGLLYAATFNKTPDKATYAAFTRTGAEVWRTGIPNRSPNDPCAQVVYIALSTLAPATLKVDGTGARLLPSAGGYQVPLTQGPKLYEITLDYADGSLFKDQIINVNLKADGSADITHHDPTSQGTQGVPQVNQYWERRMSGGGGNAGNIIIESMTAFTPTGGTSAMYAGVRNAAGAFIFKSTDGASWSAGSFPAGFGDVNIVSVNDLATYGSRIYAAVEVAANGGTATYAELYESSDGNNWTPVLPRISAPPVGSELESYEDLTTFGGSLWVAAANLAGGPTPGKVLEFNGSNWNDRTPPNLDADNVGFTSLAEFKGNLYAGTRNALGAQIWRKSGTAWSLVAQSGIANRNNWDISVMTVFKDMLYVGTTNTTNGAELYATADGVNFIRIFDRGLDSTANVRIWDLKVIDGYLFLGTQAGGGGRLYRSPNGRLWSPISQPGLSNPANVRLTTIYGYRKPGTAGRSLFVGTGNGGGAEIWETALPPVQEDWERVVVSGWLWGDPWLSTVDSMAVFKGALYIGVRDDPGGTQSAVYKSITGTQWVRVGAWNLIDGLPFNNERIESMVVHNNELYIGTRTNTGGGMVYKLDEQSNAPRKWKDVTDPANRGFGSAGNVAVSALYSFCPSGGVCKLYAGTDNANGAQLHEYAGDLNWNNVTPASPFSTDNIRIGAMAEHNGQLFIGTRNVGTASLSPGGEVWHSATPGSATSWASEVTDGFANENNIEIRALLPFGGYLYAGTENSNLNASKPRGGRVYRSQTGTGNWTNVNQGGFEYQALAEDQDNDAVVSFAAYSGFLYAGTRNVVGGDVDGGEIWRTAGAAQQSDWTQIAPNGLGNPNAVEIRTMLAHAGYLFANTTNTTDRFDAWRAALPPVYTGRFAQVVGAGVRVVEETTISVTPGGKSYLVPGRGTYEVVLPGKGTYNLTFSPGCSSSALQVNVDSTGASFDNFNFATIRSPQRIDVTFPVTLTAVLSNNVPVNITGTVQIETRGLTPAPALLQVPFVNQSRKTFTMTIGVSATNVSLLASMGAITGTSNLFNVRPLPTLARLTFGAIANSVPVNTPTSVTVNAIDNEGNPITINGQVNLTDTTKTISPNSTTFTNQSSKTFNASFGVTRTNVVITATFGALTGFSNAFDIIDVTTSNVYLPVVLRNM